MKTNKIISLFYILCGIKTISTLSFFLSFFLPTVYLAIQSVVWCSSGVLHENLTFAKMCAWYIIVISFIWTIAIILSFVGKKYKWATKSSVMIFSFVTLFDVLASCLMSELVLKIPCIIISITILVIGVMAIVSMKKGSTVNKTSIS